MKSASAASRRRVLVSPDARDEARLDAVGVERVGTGVSGTVAAVHILGMVDGRVKPLIKTGVLIKIKSFGDLDKPFHGACSLKRERSCKGTGRAEKNGDASASPSIAND